MTNPDAPPAPHTDVTRANGTTLVVTRGFNAPADLVFAAWTTPALMQQWWAPKSFGISFIACEIDVRTGGTYRFEFGHPSMDTPMVFFGRYIEVVAGEKLVWTNEEAGEGGQVTTVTFVADGEGTLVTMTDAYPSKEALDEAIESGSTSGFAESFGQLDEVLAGA